MMEWGEEPGFGPAVERFWFFMMGADVSARAARRAMRNANHRPIRRP